MRKCSTSGNFAFVRSGACLTLKKAALRRCSIIAEKGKIAALTPELPGPGECCKYISLSGGFSSIAFISLVAAREKILELTASTLRVGEKQFYAMAAMARRGALERATFFISTLMKTDDRLSDKYNYYAKFAATCEENGWKYYVVNNHSKVILMRTEKSRYVLETSSNLNENPKIEQFSFENSPELYDFYAGFFGLLAQAGTDGG